MKTIGLIGGASYQSSIEYYRLINEKTNQLLGGQYSAKIVMVSLNFHEIVEAFYSDRWNHIEKIMISAIRQLEHADVDFIAICCNTLHKIASIIAQSSTLPFLHILEPTGQQIKRQKINTVGILGSKFTMQGIFHKDYLHSKFQVNSITPNEKEQEIVNTIIFDELCYGVVKEESKQTILRVITSLQQRGAQGIVLGCTELPSLLQSVTNLKIPLFNTTFFHAEAITHFALSESLQEEMHFKKVANYS
ncbi:MAG: amino acid racemase [Gammaproteobacteria bacterium]